MLLAAVLGGGAAATALAGFVPPGAELIVAGVVFVGALAVMAVRAKSKRTSKQVGACARQNQSNGGCGC
jgi:hypothetical protein